MMADGFDALLIDLDGVLYVEDAPIPGAVEAVAALQAAGMALRFVTNTTAPPRRAGSSRRPWRAFPSRASTGGDDVETDRRTRPFATGAVKTGRNVGR
jgi:hypothetical protein